MQRPPVWSNDNIPSPDPTSRRENVTRKSPALLFADMWQWENNRMLATQHSLWPLVLNFERKSWSSVMYRSEGIKERNQNQCISSNSSQTPFKKFYQIHLSLFIAEENEKVLVVSRPLLPFFVPTKVMADEGKKIRWNDLKIWRLHAILSESNRKEKVSGTDWWKERKEWSLDQKMIANVWYSNSSLILYSVSPFNSTSRESDQIDSPHQTHVSFIMRQRMIVRS